MQDWKTWSFVTKLSATLIFTSNICGDCRFQILSVCLSTRLFVHFKSSECVAAPPLTILWICLLFLGVSNPRGKWLCDLAFIKKNTFFNDCREKWENVIPVSKASSVVLFPLKSPAFWAKLINLSGLTHDFLNVEGLRYWSSVTTVSDHVMLHSDPNGQLARMLHAGICRFCWPYVCIKDKLVCSSLSNLLNFMHN